MVRTNEPTLTIKVVIQCHDDLHENLYLGYIEEYKDAKFIACVQASTAGDILKELGVSLMVLEEYRKKTANG